MFLIKEQINETSRHFIKFDSMTNQNGYFCKIDSKGSILMYLKPSFVFKDWPRDSAPTFLNFSRTNYFYQISFKITHNMLFFSIKDCHPCISMINCQIVNTI